jgi:hypothetical protein
MTHHQMNNQPEPPRASGQRLHWEDLPDHIRMAIEAKFGPVASARTMTGGFSPGMAARLMLATGETIFAKAVSSIQNEIAPRFHRREIQVASNLPVTAPVPCLRWSLDETEGDGWVVLVYDNVEGRPPAQPWEPDEFARVVSALNALTRDLTPSPVTAARIGAIDTGLPLAGGDWRRLRDAGLTHPDAWMLRHLDRLVEMDARMTDLTPGNTLLHMDLRGDNMMLTENGVVIVDWSHPDIGPAWMDGVYFAPSVAMEGGPPPEELVPLLDGLREADPDELTVGICEMAGFFIYHGLLPDVPNLPGLREFQEAQGAVARRWLTQRTGWE